MGLWIRSQNKSVLIKCKSIHLESCNKDEVIYANQGCLIGKYPKERALEILDEIQRVLSCALQANNNNQICGTTTYVYEMPKE